MNFPRFVEPFAQEVDHWERTLSTIEEVLEMLLLVQREYVYLDNIFTTEDIKKQLPKETDDFDKVTSELAEHTSRMASYGLALPATHVPRMYYQKDYYKGDVIHSISIIQNTGSLYQEILLIKCRKKMSRKFHFPTNTEIQIKIYLQFNPLRKIIF